MADTPVTPTPVGSWPTAPQRTDEPATFVTRADAWVAATPTRTAEMNALATNVNFNAESAFDSAAEAAASASNASASEDAALASSAVALGAANFVGLYSSLTGAKTAGITAEYQGAIWLLITNSSDITTAVPGVSAKWARAYGGGVIYPRTTNIEFTAEDNGKIFEYTSGTFTQTFDEAANLKSGWSITLINTAANITFDPSGSETIDRSTMGPGQVFTVICDGVSDFAVIPMAQDRRSLGITEPFENSGTFTAKKSGWHRVTAVGAGGSGGCVFQSGSGRATGGAAGGFAVKEFYALAGTAYTIVIGAGGAAVARATAGATVGNAGGNTTVAGFGVSITASGGGAGAAATGTGTTSGATGGAATGGDINATGGASGQAVSSSGWAATGGGAVAAKTATGYASGTATVAAGLFCGSGGAGVGGASGNGSASSVSTGTGGGGAAGAGSNGTNANGAAGAGFSSLTAIQLNSAGGSGNGIGSPGAVSGNGGGGGGSGLSGGSAGGLFAGGGACAGQIESSAAAGAGGRGAGGGASSNYDNAAGAITYTSGAGGSGLVIVEY